MNLPELSDQLAKSYCVERINELERIVSLAESELALLREQLTLLPAIPKLAPDFITDIEIRLSHALSQLVAGDKLWYCEKDSRVYHLFKIESSAHDPIRQVCYVHWQGTTHGADYHDCMRYLPETLPQMTADETKQFYKRLFAAFHQVAHFSLCTNVPASPDSSNDELAYKKRMGAIHSCEICAALATTRYYLYIPVSIDSEIPDHLMPFAESRSFHEDGIGSKSSIYRCASHTLDEKTLPDGVSVMEYCDRTKGFLHL